ncbi:MAG: sulfite reductase SirA [Chloroflexota bacterium]
MDGEGKAPAAGAAKVVREVKETKAQRAERLKAERNPWEMMPDIVRWSREGFASIPPDDLNTRLRWWGIYTQGDGLGKFGDAVQRFMVRVRIASGILSAHQLRMIGDLAERYAGGFADVTTRQNFQFHWVTIEDLPNLLFGLQRVGLTTLAACGDDTRNITGCPLAGLDRDEVCDATPLVHQATQMLVGNADFYNLPRKYKISITGCKVWCSYPEINDVGLTALTRPSADGGAPEVGYSLRVAGGLSTAPHLARRLNAFVLPHQVPAVVRGITELFRDSDILRQKRDQARLKFLFLEYGWTPEQFQEELERRIGFALEPAAAETPPHDAYRDHVGVHPQKQDGYSYLGLSIVSGRMTADQIRTVAALAEQYGDGSVRTTNMQNIVIANVRDTQMPALVAATEEAGFATGGAPFTRGMVACTGIQFCKLSLTETKSYGRELAAELDRRIPGFPTNIKINVTGCPNDCGQRWISDIGLQGGRMKAGGEQVEAYDVFLGGGLGATPEITRRMKYRVPATEIPDALERVARTYLARRDGDESFHAFCRRHTDEELHAFLAGAPEVGASVEAVEAVA